MNATVFTAFGGLGGVVQLTNRLKTRARTQTNRQWIDRFMMGSPVDEVIVSSRALLFYAKKRISPSVTGSLASLADVTL
jgi:hypothetical protein